jgi:hypothetical protein
MPMSEGCRCWRCLQSGKGCRGITSEDLRALVPGAGVAGWRSVLGPHRTLRGVLKAPCEPVARG